MFCTSCIQPRNLFVTSKWYYVYLQLVKSGTSSGFTATPMSEFKLSWQAGEHRTMKSHVLQKFVMYQLPKRSGDTFSVDIIVHHSMVVGLDTHLEIHHTAYFR